MKLETVTKKFHESIRFKYNKGTPVPTHLMFVDILEEAKYTELYFLFQTMDSHLNAEEGCFVNFRSMYFEQVDYACKGSKLERIRNTWCPVWHRRIPI